MSARDPHAAYLREDETPTEDWLFGALAVACGADRALDAEDGLLGGDVLIPARPLISAHVTDDTGDRPKIVRKFLGLFRTHTQDCLAATATLYHRRVGKRLFGQWAGTSLSPNPVGGSGDRGYDYLHNPIIPYVSSRDDG